MCGPGGEGLSDREGGEGVLSNEFSHLVAA